MINREGLFATDIVAQQFDSIIDFASSTQNRHCVPKSNISKDLKLNLLRLPKSMMMTIIIDSGSLRKPSLKTMMNLWQLQQQQRCERQASGDRLLDGLHKIRRISFPKVKSNNTGKGGPEKTGLSRVKVGTELRQYVRFYRNLR